MGRKLIMTELKGLDTPFAVSKHANGRCRQGVWSKMPYSHRDSERLDFAQQPAQLVFAKLAAKEASSQRTVSSNHVSIAWPRHRVIYKNHRFLYDPKLARGSGGRQTFEVLTLIMRFTNSGWGLGVGRDQISKLSRYFGQPFLTLQITLTLFLAGSERFSFWRGGLFAPLRISKTTLPNDKR